jgi:hypothetical protein
VILSFHTRPRAAPLIVAPVVVAVADLFLWIVGRNHSTATSQRLSDHLRIRALVETFTRHVVSFTDPSLAAVGFFVYEALATFFPTFLVQYISVTAHQVV